MAQQHLDYLLHLADNALILGQRNAEWCGHGPVLEEDLALANMSLDLIGQARLLYQHVAILRNDGSTEDSLAYFRDVPDFRNYTLLELPHSTALAPTAGADRDYAATIARNFLYSTLMVALWHGLQASTDLQLAAIAAKSVKEASYHLRHSRDWLVRLGDGTDESHARMQQALDHFMPYVQEFWAPSDMEAAAARDGVAVDVTRLREGFDATLDDALAQATLKRPKADANGFVHTGKQGLHSEHLGFVLAEMQSLARAHPEGVW